MFIKTIVGVNRVGGEGRETEGRGGREGEGNGG